MKRIYEDIFGRLEEAVGEGKLDTVQWLAIRNMSKRICDYMTDNKYHKINMEVKSVMGGQVLEYESKQILRQGIAQGITQGISQGISQGIAQGIVEGIVTSIRNLMSSLSMTADEAMEALKVPKSEYEKYRKML